MRPIHLYGVVGGLSSPDLAINVHVLKALSVMTADGSERNGCKIFLDHLLEVFERADAIYNEHGIFILPRTFRCRPVHNGT